MRRRTLAALLVASGAGLAGCGAPAESCWQIKSCGSKQLSACTNYESGCRYESSDGHSWSCSGNQVRDEYGTSLACTGTPCEVAGQEAVDWCFSQTDTTTPSAYGQLVITELMVDPDLVADEAGEWLELYNRGGGVYDLFGCELRDGAHSHTVAGHVLVPAGAFRTAASFATGGGFVPDYTYAGLSFANDTDGEVSLWCAGALIDRFPYVASQAATRGHALSLDAQHYSADDNDRSSYVCPAKTTYHSDGAGTSDYGTPGAPNPHCP
jgi:hypothetical protein